MEQVSVPFLAAMGLIAFAVMFRAVKLSAAILLIVIVMAVFAYLPASGIYAKHLPSWLFWGVVIVLGINVLKTIVGVLFGRSAADSFTGKLLYGILTPIFNAIGALLRAIFRVK